MDDMVERVLVWIGLVWFPRVFTEKDPQQNFVEVQEEYLTLQQKQLGYV